MIGLLRGLLLEKQPPQLLIEVNGVGYEVDAPMSTFYKLPDIGQSVTLFTHFVVREDAQQLYGFYTKEERLLFRALLKVNGVGPKLGLTILSSVETAEFMKCIATNDAASLVRVPGIGKKTAERLIIEMRDKIEVLQNNTHPMMTSDSVVVNSNNQILQDAISALVALGYKPQEASRVISKMNNDTNLSSEELIRRALRERVI